MSVILNPDGKAAATVVTTRRTSATGGGRYSGQCSPRRYPPLRPPVADSGGASWARRRRAFTLIEVLVALTIGSLLVVAVVSATRALAGARQSVDHRVAGSSSARRAMGAIVSALRNVRRIPVPDRPVIVGQHAPSRSRLGLGSGSGGQSGGDRIDLQVVSDRRVRPDGAESDQYEVSFYLAKLSPERLPVLMCRRDHGLDDHPADGGIATVVAEGIVALTFEYYSAGASPSLGQWLGEWPSSEPRAPEAVRVTLEAVGWDPAGPPRLRKRGRASKPVVLSTVVAIHVIDSLGELPPDTGSRRDSGTGGAQPEGMRP